jgi:hypothetical protein
MSDWSIREAASMVLEGAGRYAQVAPEYASIRADAHRAALAIAEPHAAQVPYHLIGTLTASTELLEIAARSAHAADDTTMARW